MHEQLQVKLNLTNPCYPRTCRFILDIFVVRAKTAQKSDILKFHEDSNEWVKEKETCELKTRSERHKEEVFKQWWKEKLEIRRHKKNDKESKLTAIKNGVKQRGIPEKIQ